MGLVSSQMENENTTFYVKITFDKLKIDIADVYTRIGNNNQSGVDDFREQILDIISNLPIRCQIKAGYRLYNLHYDHSNTSGLYIGNLFFNMDKIVTSQLKKSEKAVIFTCTIGPAMETWSKQALHNGEPEVSYLIDIIASIATEKAVEYLHVYLGKQMFKQGLNITNRYSPGYCNWSVADQHILFSLLPENFCGISLNKSALMTPIKSISGVIGVGSQIKFEDYHCESCFKKDCTYRIIQSQHLTV